MRLLRRLAADVLGEEKARLVWSRMDLVGDILLIKSPRIHGASDVISIEEYRLVAERVMEVLPYVRSVWLAVAPVSGEERTRPRLVHLAGEKRTRTVYKEHGCRFVVDIEKVFVTPRLNYEHIRVARLVAAGERVVNMFAGAGLFSVIIACKAEPEVVHSIDINPYAVELMKENIRINKVEDRVKVYLGDAARVVEEKLRDSSDRVLMPLPELALEYLPYALDALDRQGFIHVYLHVRAGKGASPERIAAEAVEARLKVEDVSSYRLAGARVVRPVGPRVYQVVVDAWARRAR